VEGGEGAKNDPAAPARLQRVFDEWKMDRQSVVVVIGGGALQDMAGYAAATTHRGIRVVRLPTTVLAQNDSGVGVKTGINARGKKNFLGTFTPPFAVIDDFRFLETLDGRDKRAGMAEAVKVALIKDGTFFDWLEQNARALADFDAAAVAHMIERCATLHLDHIAGGGDPFELGSSRPLDFGHWAAHKLESLSDYSLRHGEAVAIGIALDTRYSKEADFITEEAAERTIGLLERLGLGTYHSALDERDVTGRRIVLDGIDEFREHLGGELTVMMLEEIGRGREVYELRTELIDRSIAWLCRRVEGDAPPLRPATPASPPSPAVD
jgi:3-dehydroquinate synthase